MSHLHKFRYIIPILVAFVAFETILLGNGAILDAATGETPADTGDIAWICCSSVLVFLMIPGLALFYGGLLRKESMTSILVQTTIIVIFSGIIWVICGYSLAFSGDTAGFIGNFDFLFMDKLLDDVSADSENSLLFAVFQLKFVIITAAIIIGACAERIRFQTISVFIIFWTLLVYVPVCHWVWGGGFLSDMFTIVDYAGGTVVHTLAGCSGLALALFAGPRLEKIRGSKPHSIPLVYLGVFLLWVGWFGFNGGSGLVAGESAIRSVAATAASGFAATAVWIILEYHFTKHVTILGLGTGILAGLVFITPMAAYVSMSSALAVGAIGGIICYVMYQVIHKKFKFDDALDVFAVHGVGGIFGTIMTAFFVQIQYGAAADGLLFGGSADLLIGNIIAVVVVAAFCFIVTYILMFIVNKLIPGKITPEEEEKGQDILEHDEMAYN